MKDPFFLPPIPWLSEQVQPWADYFDLPTLPLHIHEVLFAAVVYSVVFYPISPLLSNWLAPAHYSKLPRKRRLNWDAHVVSMFQCILINGLAIWVMFTDDELNQMDWEERVWGYTGASGFIQAFAAGYFLWDLVVTSLNFDVFGIGTLAHAIAALFVYSLGFVRRPSHLAGPMSANISPAPIRQLLCYCLHHLGTLHPISQRSLVHGQGGHDWFTCAALQWHDASRHLFLMPSRLRHLFVLPRLPRYLVQH